MRDTMTIQEIQWFLEDLLSECDVEQIRQIIDTATDRKIGRINKGLSYYDQRDEEQGVVEQTIEVMEIVGGMSKYDPEGWPEPDPADVYAQHWDNF